MTKLDITIYGGEPPCIGGFDEKQGGRKWAIYKMMDVAANKASISLSLARFERDPQFWWLIPSDTDNDAGFEPIGPFETAVRAVRYAVVYHAMHLHESE